MFMRCAIVENAASAINAGLKSGRLARLISRSISLPNLVRIIGAETNTWNFQRLKELTQPQSSNKE